MNRLNQYSYKTKRLILWAGAVLLGILANKLSFSKTIEAARIYSHLKTEGNATADISVNMPFLVRKDSVLSHIVKQYKIDPKSWDDQLWNKLSGMALASKAQIAYTPAPAVEADTVSEAAKTWKNQFKFSGAFNHLVTVLDTITKTPGIGKISAVKMGFSKEPSSLAVDRKSLQMELSFIGIK